MNKELNTKCSLEIIGTQVSTAAKLVSDASKAFRYVPNGIKYLLSPAPDEVQEKEGIVYNWQKFYSEPVGYVTYERHQFLDFVKATIPRGLSTTLDKLKKVCREDYELLNLLDEMSCIDFFSDDLGDVMLPVGKKPDEWVGTILATFSKEDIQLIISKLHDGNK